MNRQRLHGAADLAAVSVEPRCHPIAGYHVLARGGTPVNVAGLAYDYLVAANGVFVSARNAYLAATVHVAATHVRGLREAQASLELVHGRMSRAIWDGILAAAEVTAGRELLVEVAWADADGYQLRFPQQDADAVQVRYERSAGVVLQLHSHHGMPAYFSATDTQDEQGLGLYGVVGGLDGEQPQVLLRLGIYGHFQAVPWDAVFAGQLDGFTDLAVAPSDLEQPLPLPFFHRTEEHP